LAIRKIRAYRAFIKGKKVPFSICPLAVYVLDFNKGWANKAGGASLIFPEPGSQNSKMSSLTVSCLGGGQVSPQGRTDNKTFSIV